MTYMTLFIPPSIRLHPLSAFFSSLRSISPPWKRGWTIILAVNFEISDSEGVRHDQGGGGFIAPTHETFASGVKRG